MNRADWRRGVDPGHPAWRGYRRYLDQLGGGPFPGSDELQALLAADTRSGSGAPLRFRPAEALPGVDYEAHLFHSGEVSTRAENWHDLCNALVWGRWPRIKAALNARHVDGLAQTRDGRRGPLRDALTLFDECGVLIVSAEPALLEALAARNWPAAFVGHRGAWAGATRLEVIGHAILEKCLKPYKALTAQALLLCAPAGVLPGPAALDAWLAGRLLAGQVLTGSEHLAPVPLMGVPGWWAAQGDAFYADTGVFRAPSAGLAPAPTFHLEED